MTKIDPTRTPKKVSRRVYVALLNFAYSDKQDPAIGCEWLVTSKVIKFTISKAQLQYLYGGMPSKQTFTQIRSAIADYLPKILDVIKEMKTRRDLRIFELHLWEDTKEGNLARFDREWDLKAEEWKSRAKLETRSVSTTEGKLAIDWRTACKKLLELQKQQLTIAILNDLTS